MNVSPRGVGYSNVVNDRDHGALARIAAAFCTMMTLLFFMARLLIRWPWHSLFRKDDFMALGATLLSIAQISVTISAVDAGLGKMPQDVTHQVLVKADRLIYASNLLYVATMFASKLVIALFFHRLSNSAKHERYAFCITIACAICFFVSFLITALQNDVSRPWLQGPSNEGSILARWIVMEVLSSLIDISTVVFPAFLVWGLQMQRSNKLRVVGAFTLRLPLLVLAILRLISIADSLSSNITLFKYATVEIYTQVEMCYNLVSGTIPCLGIFMQAARSGMLGGSVVDVDGVDESQLATAGSSSGTRNPLSRNRQKRAKIEGYATELTNWSRGETATKAVAGSDRISMASDSSERGIVVRQTIDVQYTNDRSRSDPQADASDEGSATSRYEPYPQASTQTPYYSISRRS